MSNFHARQFALGLMFAEFKGGGRRFGLPLNTPLSILEILFRIDVAAKIWSKSDERF